MTVYLSQSNEDIARAASRLRGGQLVAFGTETVYGLGALASSPESVARVFAAKNRPTFNPLISHFSTADAALAHCVVTPLATRLAAEFWPGPMTLILPRHPRSSICDLACAGLPTVAVRVPGHPVTRALLSAVGGPVAAPSANPSGRLSPTTAQHVMDGLAGRIDAVCDMGACASGIESTVIDLSAAEPQLLRPGGVTLEALRGILGDGFTDAWRAPSDANHPVRSPGMLTSHYAPRLRLRLDAQACTPDEALLAFGTPLCEAPLIWNLSPHSDLTEAAARLYAGLHMLDAAGHARGLKTIAVMPLPREGLGLAITDRLRRAAAPRPDQLTQIREETP